MLYPIENSYILSKKKDEAYIKKYCKRFCIVRPAAPYGSEIKEFKPNRAQPLHVLAQATKLPILPIIGSGNNTRQPLYVDDLSKFIVLLSKSRKIRKVYTIGGPEVMTYNQIVDILLKVKQRKTFKLHVPILIAKHIAKFVSFTDPENIVASTINEKSNDNWQKDFRLQLTYFKKGCVSLP